MSDQATTRKALEALRDPSLSLPRFGWIIDQKTGKKLRYDSKAITKNLQDTILSYVSNPPISEHGQTKWLALLGYRQGGKSTSAELAFYTRAAYTYGHDHVCIADKKERADYLHQRVHVTHAQWPEEVRSPTVKAREVRQLTFDPEIGLGGKMRILSAQGGAVGIGQSPDSMHGSECPFWPDAGSSMNLIQPSMINRDHSLMLLESTPAPSDAPSVEWWRDLCRDAKMGLGRWVYAFFPYWDGVLNSRPWNKDWSLENNEIRLLEEFGPKGLTKDNLAFRRLMLETDTEMRRHPGLFDVFYPKDDISCWFASSKGVIPKHVIQNQLKNPLQEWDAPYMEYEAPEGGAIYAIGVDPAGYAARDHAAFQVLKVYDGEWTQVACYAGHTEPVEFAREIIRVHNRYNSAKIGVEINGVGAAVVALLQEAGVKNHLYYEKPFRPGITTTSKSLDQMLGWLIDAFRDELIICDRDTIAQALSYGHDKRTERSVVAELLQGNGQGSRRRERHHWDKISALIMAIVVARDLPRRSKKETPEELENILLFKDMTYDQVTSYRESLTKDEADQQRTRRRYRSSRKRRK